MNRLELKNRVIELARDHLYKLGVDRLRIDNLCSELGISKRTFYEMFETKDQLIELCFRLTLTEHRSVVNAIEEDVSTYYKKLCDLLDYYVLFVYRLHPVPYKDIYMREYYLQIIDDLKGFWSGTIKKAFVKCNVYMMDGIDCDFYSRFVAESINNCRLENIPAEKTETVVFHIVRGCIKKEFLYE